MRKVHVFVALGLSLALVAGFKHVSMIPLFFIVWLNVGAFLLYALDKAFSVHSATRVPERWLIVIAALGGVAGASFAQGVFRHKTSKSEFQLRYAVAALIGVLLCIVIVRLG